MNKFFAILLLTFVSVTGQVKHTLEEIIVEGKQEIDAIGKRKQSPFPLMIITSRQIKGFGHQTAGDVIKHLPRLYMQGPLNLQRNVKMAGLDKEFQTILINGERPFGGADRRDIKLDRIPVNMIERIEIISNPPSNLVSDAVSGVINIITKKNVSSDNLSININSGTQTVAEKFNNRGSVNYSGRFNNFSIVAGLSIDDYVRTVESEIKKLGIKGDDTETIDVTTAATNLHLKYETEKSQITFTPYISNYKEFTDIKTVNSLNNLVYENQYDTEDKLRRLQSYSAGYKYKFNSTDELKVNLGISDNREEKFKIRDKKTLTKNEFKYEDEIQMTTDYSVKLDYLFTNNLFGIKGFAQFGGHFRFNDREVDRVVSFQKTPDSDKIPSNESYKLEEKLLSIYGQNNFNLSENIQLLLGLRYEYAIDDYQFETNTGNRSYSFLNPSISFGYDFSEEYLLKASVSRQLSRAPYMYVVPIVKRKNRKTEMGNVDLNPSSSINFDLSVQKYFSGSNYIILNGFYKDITDIIEQAYVGTDALNNDNPIFKAINIAEAKVYGADLEVKYTPEFISKHFNITSHISWMGSSVKDPRTSEDRRLKDQPDYIVNLLFNYINPINGFDITLGINHIGERIDPESSSINLITDPFTQIDCQVKYHISNTFSVYMSGKNILGNEVKSNMGSQSTVEDFGSIFRFGFNYRIF